MSKEKRPPSGGVKKGGYQPLNEGYTPTEKRGYTSGGQSTGLPKAPVGGTGQTRSQIQNKTSGTVAKK